MSNVVEASTRHRSVGASRAARTGLIRIRLMSVIAAVVTSSTVSPAAAFAETIQAPMEPEVNTVFEDSGVDHTFTYEIAWLADAGITRGCNPPDNTRFCPDQPVTRGQMAAFLNRTLKLPAATTTFTDTAGHLFEADIAALASAGITRGCNPPDNTRFCPDQPVTRGQMAAFLTRALELPSGNATFTDARGHLFEMEIGALATAGITRGCNPPANDRFCPDQAVTRAEMAAFLHRAQGSPKPWLRITLPLNSTAAGVTDADAVPLTLWPPDGRGPAVWDPIDQTLTSRDDALLLTDSSDQGYLIGQDRNDVGFFWDTSTDQFIEFTGPGGSRVVPTAVNDNAQVVGEARLSGGLAGRRAFVWEPGDDEARLLDTPPDHTSSGWDVNHAGVAVGLVTPAPSGSERTALWDVETGEVTVLPLPPGFGSSMPSSINDAGDVVGTIHREADPNGTVFHWNADRGYELLSNQRLLRALGAAGSMTALRVEDLNDHGLVLGWVAYGKDGEAGDSAERLFLWDPRADSLTLVPALHDGGTQGALNNRGLVALVQGEDLGIWDPGKGEVTRLQSPSDSASVPISMSNDDWVVGTAFVGVPEVSAEWTVVWIPPSPREASPSHAPLVSGIEDGGDGAPPARRSELDLSLRPTCSDRRAPCPSVDSTTGLLVRPRGRTPTRPGRYRWAQLPNDGDRKAATKPRSRQAEARTRTPRLPSARGPQRASRPRRKRGSPPERRCWTPPTGRGGVPCPSSVPTR
jgi:hypothetical protein